MKRLFNINPFLRATGVIGAVAVCVTGITFAALNSQATLTGSTLTSADASLLIYNGSTFASTATGFNITGLIPGTPGTTGNPGTDGSGTTEHVYFQNAGGTPIAITATVPTLPAAPAGGYGFSDFHNVTVNIFGEACNTNIQTTLFDLNAGAVTLPCTMAAGATGNSSAPGTSGNYDFTFNINEAAVTGSSAGVGPFDVDFNGVQTP